MKTPNRIFLAGLLLAAAPAFAAKPVDVSHAAAANATVQISNIAGSVKIVGWNKDSVHVTGSLADPDERLKVSGDKDNLEIKVIYPDTHTNHAGATLVVHAPRAAIIQATTVSADISAGDLIGTLRLQSVSGDISVACKSPEIHAQTVSGSVDVNGSAAKAHVEMDSVSGNTHASGVTGELTGQSVSGKVGVDGGRLSRATLSTTSGLTVFKSPILADGNYKFNTVSGRIVMDLPNRPDAEFDITTFAGSISNDFGPKPEKVSKYSSGTKLHFTNGKGGAYVSASSMGGEIDLKAGS